MHTTGMVRRISVAHRLRFESKESYEPPVGKYCAQSEWLLLLTFLPYVMNCEMKNAHEGRWSSKRGGAGFRKRCA